MFPLQVQGSWGIYSRLRRSLQPLKALSENESLISEPSLFQAQRSRVQSSMENNLTADGIVGVFNYKGD